MEKDLNFTIKTAMDVLDQFYTDTASLLETIKDILIKDYGYKHIRDNQVCWEGSTSSVHSDGWLPVYLCLYLRDKDKEDSYIGVLILLKDCWNYRRALTEYNIYGCKLDGVKNHNTVYWLCKDSAESNDPKFIRKECAGYTEVFCPELFQSCKIFKQSLWDIKDVLMAKKFASRLAKL